MELPRFSAARSKFFCMVVIPDVFLPHTIAPLGPEDHPSAGAFAKPAFLGAASRLTGITAPRTSRIARATWHAKSAMHWVAGRMLRERQSTDMSGARPL